MSRRLAPRSFAPTTWLKKQNGGQSIGDHGDPVGHVFSSKNAINMRQEISITETKSIRDISGIGGNGTVLTPLTTPIFDFHSVERAYDSDLGSLVKTYSLFIHVKLI